MTSVEATRSFESQASTPNHAHKSRSSYSVTYNGAVLSAAAGSMRGYETTVGCMSSNEVTTADTIASKIVTRTASSSVLSDANAREADDNATTTAAVVAADGEENREVNAQELQGQQQRSPSIDRPSLPFEAAIHERIVEWLAAMPPKSEYYLQKKFGCSANMQVKLLKTLHNIGGTRPVCCPTAAACYHHRVPVGISVEYVYVPQDLRGHGIIERLLRVVRSACVAPYTYVVIKCELDDEAPVISPRSLRTRRYQAFMAQKMIEACVVPAADIDDPANGRVLIKGDALANRTFAHEFTYRHVHDDWVYICGSSK